MFWICSTKKASFVCVDWRDVLTMATPVLMACDWTSRMKLMPWSSGGTAPPSPSMDFTCFSSADFCVIVS